MRTAQPHQTYPAVGLIELLGPVRIRDLVVDIVPVDQVLHDGTGLEELDAGPVRHDIGQGRYASVGVDLHEPFTFVVHVGKTDMLDIV